MVDNVTLNSGSGGATLAADDIAGIHHQRVKIEHGADGSATDVSTASPLPVDLRTNNIGNIDVNIAASAATVTVDASGAAVPVTDNAGSLTVDHASLDLAHSEDFDTGVGTDNTMAVGIAVPASGGAVVIPGDATAGLKVDLGADNDVTVTGTVTVQDGGNVISVDDAAGSLTIDNAALSVTGGGVEATALRVTLASDSTGVVSVDDNGSTLSIDDGAGSITVDNAGTFAVQASQSTASSLNAQVVGAVAHDAVNSGNPISLGARATNSIEGVTQVANDDKTYLQADLNGVLITRPHTTLEEIISERVADTAGTSTNFTNFAAGGVGIHNYVTTISIYNSSATDGYVDFRDGSAGSVIFTAAAPATGGSVINLPVPLKGAANTALAYDVSGALTTVYITVIGFQAQG